MTTIWKDCIRVSGAQPSSCQIWTELADATLWFAKGWLQTTFELCTHCSKKLCRYVVLPWSSFAEGVCVSFYEPAQHCSQFIKRWLNNAHVFTQGGLMLYIVVQAWTDVSCTVERNAFGCFMHLISQCSRRKLQAFDADITRCNVLNSNIFFSGHFFFYVK